MKQNAGEEDNLLPSGVDPNELHEQIKELNDALQKAEQKAQEHWDSLLRNEAEKRNLMEQSRRDMENARKFALERFSQDLLEVADSLDQGVTFAHKGQAKITDLLEGMRLTQTVLSSVLEKHGVTCIQPQQGESFDPHFHEAIAAQPSETVAPNCIIEVIQKGYSLQNRLLRPARVVVSKAE